VLWLVVVVVIVVAVALIVKNDSNTICKKAL
jgi:hypothetical protein